MQEVDLYSLLDCAINASIKAGDEIMKIYDSNFEFTTKEDDSPLTIADKNSNAIIEYNSSNEIIYNKEELLNPWFLVS